MSNKPGFESALQALRGLDPEQQENLLKTMAASDPEMAEKLRSGLIHFEDLVKLNTSEIGQLLESTSSNTLALALRNASEGLLDHFMGALAKRRAEALKDDMDRLGPQPLSKVREAQTEIFKTLKRLGIELIIE